jgi:hypothetical protein
MKKNILLLNFLVFLTFFIVELKMRNTIRDISHQGKLDSLYILIIVHINLQGVLKTSTNGELISERDLIHPT